MKHIILGAALALTVCTVASADKVINVPSGWSLDLAKSPHSISPSGAAVVLYKQNATPPPYYEATRVMQVEDGAVASQTDFSGTVFRVDYSPNGQLLLVHEADSNEAWPVGSRYLLRSDGSVQWTKTDEARTFRFAPSGVVFAMRGIGPSTKFGRDIEIFAGNGDSIRTVHFGHVINDATVLASGDIVVASIGHSLIAQDVTTSPPQVIWQTDLAEFDMEVLGLWAVSETRLIVSQEFGRFLVVDASDGNVLYRYNSEYLASVDPSMTMADYGSFSVFEGPDPSHFTLLNRQGDTLGLDVVTGVLSPTAISTSKPSGCVLKNDFRHDTLIILCPGSVRIRSTNQQ